MPSRRCQRLLLPLLLALGLLPAGAAQALGVDLRLGGVRVGLLSTEGPLVTAAPGGAAGVSFWASWALLPDAGLVAASDLRWLQRAAFSRPVVGFPERPFIDPRPGQSLGGARADGLPWYDVTGPTRAGLSLTGGGDDPWMGDGPFAPLSLAPLEFVAETLVVVVDALRQEARLLGGVRWGYALSSLGASPIAPTALSDAAPYRTLLNEALGADFPGWRIVPEPGSAALLLCALAALGAVRRTRHDRV